MSSPETVLDDSSVPPDLASWRVFPYPANASEVIGTTITISKRLDPFVRALRELGEELNFPIIPLSFSSPLVTIMGLGDIIRHTPEKPFVAVLQYPWFTAMAFFNEHADIQLIRTLQHRGQRRPSNFRHALTTTNASLEFIDPDIFVLSLGAEVDKNSVAEIKSVLPFSRVEDIHFPAADPIPLWMPEVIISTTPSPENSENLSHTFTVLRSEKWALQDFLPAPAEVIELYPTRSEMKLLRFLKLGRVGVFAVAVLILAWITLSVIDTVRRPEWAFNNAESDAVKRRLNNLVQERQRADHWSNLLEDRSKAWTSMESLARLFPNKSGLLVKTYTHTIKPDTAPGQAKVGFIKEWLISGLARDEALTYLNTLNTRDGITAHFDEVAALTGNNSFDSKPTTRSIVVNVRVQENQRFRQLTQEEFHEANEESYPHTFTLSITQRFESGDPLALTAISAP